MTKSELIHKAKARGVKVNTKMTVVEIRAAMRAAAPIEPPVSELPRIFSRPRPPRRPAGAYGGPNPGAYIRNPQGG